MVALTSEEQNHRRKKEWRKTATGLLFAAPWILRLLFFIVIPVFTSLYLSFTYYPITRPPKFTGLENYVELLTQDPNFTLVMKNTLYFVLIGVPVMVSFAFLMANLLNTRLKGISIFRTIFYIPTIVPAVATVMIWLWIYNPQYGLVNSILKGQGLPTIPFLSNPAWAKPSLILVMCWAQGNSIMIFLAALQDVPRSLYDAALVDGANQWQRFRNVTIPMCTPAIMFVLLNSLIATFQLFELPWLMTEGGPNRSTELLGIYLYRNAFNYFKMGYASTIAWMMFLLIGTMTFLIFRSSARWVFYGGQKN